MWTCKHESAHEPSKNYTNSKREKHWDELQTTERYLVSDCAQGPFITATVKHTLRGFLSRLSHCYWQFLRYSVVLWCRKSRGNLLRPVILLSTLDLKKRSNSLRSRLPVCLHALFPPRIPLCNKEEAAVKCSEGVNDLWSAPAADVGGMEVNRDEVFSIAPQLTWLTPLMFPSVFRHCLSCYNELGVSPS